MRCTLSAISIVLCLVVAFVAFGVQQEIPTGTPAPCDGAYGVLIVHADCGLPPATLRPNLLAEPGISQVDIFDGGAGTPGGFQ